MLKQTSHKNRILFLKIFTQELILNSKPRKSEKSIEEELGGQAEEKEAERKEGKAEEIKEPIEAERFMPSIIPIPKFGQEVRPEIKPRTKLTGPSKLLELKKKIAPIRRPVLRPPRTPIQPRAQPLVSPTERIKPKFTMPVSGPPKIEGAVDLGKLNMFLSDKAITEIECPGPSKFIVVKKAGQVNLTKVTLSQKEINKLIEDFSKRARIPIISGIFKASIGNLTITAVVSEFVGSRFIVYKVSPYSILEQQTQQLQQAELQAQFQHGRRLK